MIKPPCDAEVAATQYQSHAKRQCAGTGIARAGLANSRRRAWPAWSARASCATGQLYAADGVHPSCAHTRTIARRTYRAAACLRHTVTRR